jgi:hypothetical protein
VSRNSRAAAVEAFLAPIQKAASTFGKCKITGGGKGYRSPELGADYSWALNTGEGMKIPTFGDDLRFFASMGWRVVEDDQSGPFRVTTTRYDYSLRFDSGVELWAHHWHPAGMSTTTTPHIHLGAAILSANSSITPKSHLPSGRMTFETAIRWVVESGGNPDRLDWEEQLELAEQPYLLYRQWSDKPTAP